MRRYFLFLIILAALLMAWVVSAQDGYPTGYTLVYSAPNAGMHPVGYTCTLTAYDASAGMAKVELPAQVDAYVVWLQPVRPADYYVSFTQNGIHYWAIDSQQTLDAVCK